MNYYQPLQSKSGGWHFCCHNKRLGTFPVGYCSEHAPHETEQLARECYTTYLLDTKMTLSLVDDNSQRHCAVCGEWTNLYAQVDIQHYYLCEQHNNRDEIAKLFGIVGNIISSW